MVGGIDATRRQESKLNTSFQASERNFERRRASAERGPINARHALIVVKRGYLAVKFSSSQHLVTDRTPPYCCINPSGAKYGENAVG
jgi:hypothetical protein